MMGLSLLGSTFISRLHSHCYHIFCVYVGARHAAAVYGGDYYDGDGDGDESGGCQRQSATAMAATAMATATAMAAAAAIS